MLHSYVLSPTHCLTNIKLSKFAFNSTNFILLVLNALILERIDLLSRLKVRILRTYFICVLNVGFYQYFNFETGYQYFKVVIFIILISCFKIKISKNLILKHR